MTQGLWLRVNELLRHTADTDPTHQGPGGNGMKEHEKTTNGEKKEITRKRRLIFLQQMNSFYIQPVFQKLSPTFSGND